MISSFALLPFRPRAIHHFRSQLSFPANFMITMRYYSYSAIYLREWRLNVHDEVARMKKKKRADYPSISIDKYRHEKLSSEHARWDRVSISVSAESMRCRIRTHTYKHTCMHRPMDFLRGITFVARETDLLERAISLTISLPMDDFVCRQQSLLLQLQPRDRVNKIAEQRAADSPVVAGNWRIRIWGYRVDCPRPFGWFSHMWNSGWSCGNDRQNDAIDLRVVFLLFSPTMGFPQRWFYRHFNYILPKCW